MYIIPSDLLRKFRLVSAKNNSGDGKHIETLGFLLGYKSYDNYVATDLIFPEQQATNSRVDDKGKLKFIISNFNNSDFYTSANPSHT